MGKKQPKTIAEALERKLTKEYRIPLWCKFTKAVKMYRLIEPGDRICCCISGGKDSMLLALLLKHLHKYSDFPFEIKYLVMNPGYNPVNLEAIKTNLKKLEIPATIIKTDIFDIANNISQSPCYLCAKMRRGALYRIAKMWGCNKIALGHHYDDVIITTLMNMLNSGSFQTMLPKLPSTHYEGMELIRPLYLIREADIVSFAKENDLRFIQCACRFTEENHDRSYGEGGSQRLQTKLLIQQLVESYNPMVEKNIFKAAENVRVDKLLGYLEGEDTHSFLDEYDQKKIEQFLAIKEGHIEEEAIAKAEREHKEFIIEETFSFEE